MRMALNHPFVFQVCSSDGEHELDEAAEGIIAALGDRLVQLSYSARDKPYLLGVIEGCSRHDAGQLIGNLQKLSITHPLLKVSLAGYGFDLPPTVLQRGRFTLFGEAYRTFCAPNRPA
ncbi:MAG: hypothetical protein HY692_04330 [Cyanobacteria bacterium NC_groundwater_1444_Ag_S-0.65um_54_12]|nr:hypothetical protein [Cyanobacteria bacterium NC_groundwater_1444_Ag_S-0.65um_54_12]